MSWLDMSDGTFYGVVGASLLLAGLLVALLASGEVAGPRVAQLQSHHAQQK